MGKMKRFVSLVAVLLFILTSVSAFGLTYEEAKKMSNTKLYNAMKDLTTAEEMAAFWKDVDKNANATFKARVVTQLAKCLNAMSGANSRAYAQELYEKTDNLNFTLGSSGRYTVTVGARTETGAIDNGTGYIPRTEDTQIVSKPASNN